MENSDFFFKQFYLGCLAHASYMIGSRGVAVVVDPQRDVEQYLREAKAAGLSIQHVIETHLHADFVSGHLELAKRTGAQIYLGAQARAKFEHVAVSHNQEIALGKIILRFLETPGHTPESLSILVIDPEKSPQPQMILTGDTLFIGDVGRPDLAGDAGLTPQVMAGMLYDSLWQKILPLPDATLIYPAHGAGSACGKNISNESFSTLGQQRQSNPALRKMSREAFIKMAVADLPEAPEYFSHDAEANRRGAAALEDLPFPKALSANEVATLQKQNVALLDIRDQHAFAVGHVPGSMNIGLSGMFASWAGTLLGPHQKIILIAQDREAVSEGFMRLARVGIESVIGYLEDGMAAWKKAGFGEWQIEELEVAELQRRLKQEPLQVVDVRGPREYHSGHIAQALNLPLIGLGKSLPNSGLSPQTPVAVICGSGYRSSAAISLLQHAGFKKIYNIVGGMRAWIGQELPTTAAEEKEKV